MYYPTYIDTFVTAQPKKSISFVRLMQRANPTISWKWVVKREYFEDDDYRQPPNQEALKEFHEIDRTEWLNSRLAAINKVKEEERMDKRRKKAEKPKLKFKTINVDNYYNQLMGL